MVVAPARQQRVRQELRARGGLLDGWGAILRRCAMAALSSRCFVAVWGLLAASGATAAVSAVDDAGNTVTLERAAQRIVSLAPHATEMLYAAGAGNALVGTVAH